MTWYKWNKETDEITPAKYDSMRDPQELWEPEMREREKNWHENKRVTESLIRGFWISTVFLYLDHGWGGKPILFETMIFNRSATASWAEIYSNRYETAAEARADHQRVAGISRRLLLKAPQVSNKNYKDVLRQI